MMMWWRWWIRGWRRWSCDEDYENNDDDEDHENHVMMMRWWCDEDDENEDNGDEEDEDDDGAVAPTGCCPRAPSASSVVMSHRAQRLRSGALWLVEEEPPARARSRSLTVEEPLLAREEQQELCAACHPAAVREASARGQIQTLQIVSQQTSGLHAPPPLPSTGATAEKTRILSAHRDTERASDPPSRGDTHGHTHTYGHTHTLIQKRRSHLHRCDTGACVSLWFSSSLIIIIFTSSSVIDGFDPSLIDGLYFSTLKLDDVHVGWWWWWWWWSQRCSWSAGIQAAPWLLLPAEALLEGWLLILIIKQHLSFSDNKRADVNLVMIR